MSEVADSLLRDMCAYRRFKQVERRASWTSALPASSSSASLKHLAASDHSSRSACATPAAAAPPAIILLVEGWAASPTRRRSPWLPREQVGDNS